MTDLEKARDAPTAKAISDKIDHMIIRFKTPVGPRAQHDANIHADGWNDAIKALRESIEPNLQALEVVLAHQEADGQEKAEREECDRETLKELRAKVEGWKFPPEDLKGRKGLNLMKLRIRNNTYDDVLSEIDRALERASAPKGEKEE